MDTLNRWHLLGLETTFPNLEPGSYQITSPKSPIYNCVAWAAGRTNRWWEPPVPFMGPPTGSYWPPNAPTDYSLSSITRAFEEIGYEVCANADLEIGFEKVAIYVNELGNYSHAARQLESGAWTSKLGGWEDIEHDTLEALEGQHPAYGAAVRYLRRQRD